MGLSSSSPVASSSESLPAPALPYDIWCLVAEKLVFPKQDQVEDYSMDLRHPNEFTGFMLASQTTYRAFMAQFALMRAIEFRGLTMVEPGIIMSTDTNQEDEQFHGPYLVTEAFVRALVDLRKLNLTSLNTIGYLGKWANSQQIKPGNSAIQSFCKLFLNKELSDEDATGIRFELDHLDVYNEDNKVLESTFGELLNLNAIFVEMYINQPMENFDCSSFDRSIDANRTKKLHMMYGFGNDDTQLGDVKVHWESLIVFLLDKCSTIRQIEFDIWCNYDNYAAGFVAHFGKMLDKFTEHIFPGLAKGSREARIIFNLNMWCGWEQFEGLRVSHRIKDLIKKGDAVEHSVFLPESYIARECQVTDKLGRVHKFTYWFLLDSL